VREGLPHLGLHRVAGWQLLRRQKRNAAGGSSGGTFSVPRTFPALRDFASDRKHGYPAGNRRKKFSQIDVEGRRR
jgi:hypothetical protein